MENSNLKTTSVLLLTMLLFMGCHKSDNEATPSVPKKIVVYTAGHIGDVATYWKNDSAVSLVDKNYNDQLGTPVSDARGLFVDNGVVYVSGKKHINGSQQYTLYWKDGIPVILDSTGVGLDMTVSNGNVYVAGYYHPVYFRQMAYWKNDAASIVELTNGESHSIARAISVNDEGNVYVAGYTRSEATYKAIAVYFKNDSTAVTYLSNGLRDAFAYDLIIHKGDVYVAGTEVNASGVKVAKYWINDSSHVINLSDGTQVAVAVEMAFNKGDVYVAGYESNGTNYVATYWKNGNPIALTDGTHEAKLRGIAIKNGDVYVCGYEENDAGVPVAKYWKNGVAVILSTGKYSSAARSIYLAEE